MTITRDLYQLQEIELAIESNEQTQARINAILADNQAVLKAKGTLEAAQKNLDELAKSQKQIDRDIDDLSNKIKTIDKKLYGGKVGNPKELANLQTEVEDFKKKLSGFEDISLELMDKSESARQAARTAASDLERIEKQRQNQQKELTAQLETLKTARAELEAQKQEMITVIDPATMDTYRQIRKTKGMAVSRVEQGICKGCRITLSKAKLSKAKGNDIVRCSSCGRIIFLG